jgi:hypothetical protein
MGFAQEVRDFLTGYKTVRELGQTDERGKRDEAKMEQDKAYQDAMMDLKHQELDLQREKHRSGLAQSGAAAGRAAARMQMDQEKHEAWKEDRAAAATAKAEAAKIDTFSNSAASPVKNFNLGEYVEEEDIPTTDHVGAWAEGGLVEDDPDEALPITPRGNRTGVGDRGPRMKPPEMGESSGAPSADTTPAAPQTAPAQNPALDIDGANKPPATASQAVADEKNERQSSVKIIVGRAREAATLAVDELKKVYAVPRPAVGGDDDDPMMNPGMTLAEVDQMRNAVDPNGEIPSFMRSAATLAEGFTYFKERGEPDKAVNLAKKFLMAERQASQTLGTLAVQAIEAGNGAEAVRLFNDAVNRFPSAHEISIQPDRNGVLSYTVREDGKVLEEGKMEARQFLEMAGTVADGTLYMRSLAHFVRSNDEPVREHPARAAEAAAEAHAAAQAARTAFDDSVSNRTPDGDPALKAAWEAAARTASESRLRALELGASDVSLDRSARAADERGIPTTGAAPAGTPGQQGGPPPDVPAPKTREEYEALPPGTYLHPTRGLVRKPGNE